MRFITLLLSHTVLCSFLKSNYLTYDNSNSDYEEIIKYNFSDELFHEFTRLGTHIFNLATDKYVTDSINIEQHNDDKQRIEELLFEQAMLDNRSAQVDASHRLEGISSIGNDSVFSTRYISAILSNLDNGKAALKSYFKNEKFLSKVCAGEQAFRIMNDKFEKYLKCLYDLESFSVAY